MECYKKFSTATKNNPDGNPIIRIVGHNNDSLYIVTTGPMSRFTDIGLVNPASHFVEAYISVSKLAELGNGNWATPKEGQRKHTLTFA